MGGGNETPVTAGAQFTDPLTDEIAIPNGGFVATVAFPANSPARDSGVATIGGVGTPVPSTDARGEPRFRPVDRGSYEYQDPARIFTDGFEP